MPNEKQAAPYWPSLKRWHEQKEHSNKSNGIQIQKWITKEIGWQLTERKYHLATRERHWSNFIKSNSRKWKFKEIDCRATRKNEHLWSFQKSAGPSSWLDECGCRFD